MTKLCWAANLLLSGHLPVPRVAALWKFNVKENVKKLQVK